MLVTRLFTLFLAGCLVALPVRADDLPDLGDASANVLSHAQEQAIGDAIMSDIRAHPAYLDDPEITQYLNDLGYRLLARSPDNRRDVQFFAIKDDSYNAFALPGGYIGVHSRLITGTQNESELAGVIAHEIAHVTQRHLARLIASQKTSALTSIAGLVVAILAARSNPQVANAAIATAQATAIQSQLDFTREHEREADRIGLQILNDAGFDPRGMASFFERLQRANRLYESNAPAYLRTHPLTTERIADMENRAARLPYRQVPDSLDYQLVKAKLLAEQGNPRDSLQRLESNLKDGRYANATAMRYGLAVALMRNRQYERAAKELAALRQSGVTHPILENATGQLLLAQGRAADAVTQYKDALRRFPAHRTLAYGYIDALLQANKPEEALSAAADQLSLYSTDWRLHQLQARAYAAQNKVLAQYRAQAEMYVNLGNLRAAIEQLQLGLRAKDGNFYEMSIAEARLRELQRLDKEARSQER